MTYRAGKGTIPPWQLYHAEQVLRYTYREGRRFHNERPSA